MYQVTISCSCKTPLTGPQERDPADAVKLAKDWATRAGWRLKKKTGWLCPLCIERRKLTRGVYQGGTLASIGSGLVELKGQVARLRPNEKSPHLVDALFENPDTAGNYAERWHWFKRADFTDAK